MTIQDDVLILFPNSFPIGGSSTNRIIHIAKILLTASIPNKILITTPTEDLKKQFNTLTSGHYEGVYYKYASKSLIKPDSWLKKNSAYIKSYLMVLKLLLNNNYRLVLSYADYGLIIHVLYAFIIRIIFRKKIIYIVDEYPWVIIFKDKYPAWYRKIYLHYFFKLFNGIVVITKNLHDYYSKYANKNTRFYHLPMTVEIDRFAISNSTNSMYGKFLIMYCGGGGISKNNKDGLNILIESFFRFSKKNPDAYLALVGKMGNDLLLKVKELNLLNKIKFYGFVERDKIPTVLSEADLLILTRPSSLQAEGGFPTKLGEYLATGKPVLVTKTSEISAYLQDGISAFLAEPDSVDAIVEKLTEIYNNIERAKYIGLAGKNVASKFFDYKNYALSFKQYLESFS